MVIAIPARKRETPPVRADVERLAGAATAVVAERLWGKRLTLAELHHLAAMRNVREAVAALEFARRSVERLELARRLLASKQAEFINSIDRLAASPQPETRRFAMDVRQLYERQRNRITPARHRPAESAALSIRLTELFLDELNALRQESTTPRRQIK